MRQVRPSRAVALPGLTPSSVASRHPSSHAPSDPPPRRLPALRANVDFARLRFDTPSTATAPGVDGDRTLLAGVVSMKLDLLRGPVRPYLLGGVGAFSIRDAVDGAATDDARSQVNFGTDAGAGLSLHLGPIDAFVESRLQNVYTRQRGLVDTRSITAFPVTFGIVL